MTTLRAVLGTLLLVACGSSSTSGGRQGSERQACLPDGGCDPGLTCASSVCVSIGNGGSSSGGTGGRTATGGVAATGGASSGGMPGTGGGTGYVCNPTQPGCGGCIESKCCTEYRACVGDSVCGGISGEYLQFNTCLNGHYADSGTLSNSDVTSCAAAVAKGPVLATTTQDLVSCILGQSGGAGCALECWGLVL
jgi:hypothetical protein